MQYQENESKDTEWRQVSLDLCRTPITERGAPLSRREIELIESFRKDYDDFHVTPAAQGIVVLHKTANPLNPYDLVVGKEIVKAAQLVGFKAIYAFVGRFSLMHREMMTEFSGKVIDGNEETCPIEEAELFAKLIEKEKWKVSQAAVNLGVNRSRLRKSLQLNNLHPTIKAMVANRQIDKSHASIIAKFPIPTQLELSKKVLDPSLNISVRDLELFESGRNKESPNIQLLSTRKDPNIAALEEELRVKLGCTVLIQVKGYWKGKITLSSLGKNSFFSFIAGLGAKSSHPIKYFATAGELDKSNSIVVVSYASKDEFNGILNKLKVKLRKDEE